MMATENYTLPPAAVGTHSVIPSLQACDSELLIVRQPQEVVVVASPQYTAQEMATLRQQHGTETAVGLMMLEFGPTRMTGSVVVPQRLKIVCVMHGANLDLTNAIFVHPRTEIEVVALFGGATIKLPRGVNISADKAAIFRGIHTNPRVPVNDGRPTVRITGVTIFGGVDILEV